MKKNMSNWSTDRLLAFSNPASAAWNDDRAWDALQTALDILLERGEDIAEHVLGM